MQLALIGVSDTRQRRRKDAAPSPRLVRAAHEFEGQMMKELLKPMTNGDALTGTDADEDAARARVERWASLLRKHWASR